MISVDWSNVRMSMCLSEPMDIYAFLFGTLMQKKKCVISPVYVVSHASICVLPSTSFEYMYIWKMISLSSSELHGVTLIVYGLYLRIYDTNIYLHNIQLFLFKHEYWHCDLKLMDTYTSKPFMSVFSAHLGNVFFLSHLTSQYIYIYRCRCRLTYTSFPLSVRFKLSQCQSRLDHSKLQ